MKSSAMSDVSSPFHIFSAEAIPIGYLQSDHRLHYFAPLVEYFTANTSIFHLVRTVRFLSRVYQQESKRCALNSDLCLITLFYDILLIYSM